MKELATVMDSSDCDRPSYSLLLSCPSPLSSSQLSVVFDRSYDRIPHPDATLENSVSEIWEQRVQKNPSLFNGLKFRYGGHSIRAKEASSQNTDVCRFLEETDVCLHLGLTDYRTFVGTNLSHIWKRFLVPSEDDSRRCQHTANPLGNGAVVETTDNKVIVLQRSTNVGEFPGHFVFPGGHPEPQEVGIISHDVDESTRQIVNKRVSQEMFDSIIREVVEEVGVAADMLSEPVFIGVSQRVLNVRPTAFFFIKCSLHSNKIQELYANAQDSYESTRLYTMSARDVESVTAKMPGCHQGGFALYKLMLEVAEAN